MEQVYSRIPEIDEYIIKKLNKLAENKFFINETIELEYGTKFIFVNKAGTEVPVVIYYSNKKKKLSIVNEFNGDDFIKEKINGILRTGLNMTDKEFYAPFERWIGTDEAGKGDYFGPLVTAGFYADKNILNELEELGVQDSKNFTIDGIHKLSAKLLQKFPERIISFELPPEKYNELHNKTTEQNTNAILSWCHIRVIRYLAEKYDAEGVIIDKFGSDTYITDRILKSPNLDKIKNLMIIQRIKAEENLAVAAASVIAREKYLRRMEQYSDYYGFQVPRGANEGIRETINFITEKYGQRELRKIAKIHFKNTEKII